MPMRRLTILLALILLAGVATGLRAQSVAFDVQPRALQMGERATATFVFKNLRTVPQPAMPDVPGLLFSPPQQSQQTSMVIDNGQRRSEQSVTFSFAVLPTQPGKYSIQPPAMLVGGQRIDFPAIPLEVVGSEAQGDGTSEGWREQVFARMKFSRKELYVQEVFDVEFSIYYRHVRLHGDINLANLPSMGMTIIGQHELSPGREIVNDLVYDVRRFRIIFRALTQGEFVFEPTLRAHLVAQNAARNRRSMLDSFFGNMVETVPVDLPTEAQTLRVRGIPEAGRPPNFSGAVGVFQMKVQARPQDLRAGDPVTLNLLVEGRGNIDTVEMPHIDFPEDFRVYDAKLVGREYNNEVGEGRKLFEQVVIPRSEKVDRIPPIAFSFFNPEKGEYQTLRHEPISLKVSPAESTAPAVVADGSNGRRAELHLIGEDIAYLKPAPKRWLSKARPAQTMTSTLLLQALPMVAAGVVVLLARRRNRLAGDVVRTRRQQAPRVARAQLAAAEKALSLDHRSGFYDQLWRGLTAYFGHRFNLPPGDVLPHRVVKALQEGGLEASHRQCIEDLLVACERIRYGAGSSVSWTDEEKATCRNQLQDLQEALRACERIRL